jgi:predicted amidohydrolase
MRRFAAVQMEPQRLDPAANLEKIVAFIHQTGEQGSAVAVFPECSLTGYTLSPQEAERMAEEIPGPRTERLARACKEAGLTAVMVGTVERGPDDHLFNAAALIGPEGVLACYRKTHLPFLGVDRYLAAGECLLEPIETNAGRVGMLICYDLRFPEPTRSLALSGAQVVLLSTAWPQAATLYPDFLAQTRCAENHIFLVAANRVGSENGTRFLGHSLIVAPDGQKLAEAGPNDEQILYADIDVVHSDQKDLVFRPGEYELYLFGDRRPDLYHRLTDTDPTDPV